MSISCFLGLHAYLKCEICGYGATRRGHFNIHMMRHKGEKPFSCSICSYSVVQECKLKIHMMSHTGDRPFKCTLCNYNCLRQSRLDGHMSNHHAIGEKQYKCTMPNCTYASSESSALQTHVRRSHVVDKPVKCELCSFATVSRHNLNIHMRKHTGEKPFGCELCPYTCAWRVALTVHMRTHTGERPFKCELCSHAFITKGKLKRHMLTHSGERPFKCQFCSFSCKEKPSLTIHMRSHNQEQPQQDPAVEDASQLLMMANSVANSADRSLMANSSIDRQSFKCQFCSFTCKEKPLLLIHMRSHTHEMRNDASLLLQAQAHLPYL